jgi:hypothetical protein
LRSFNASLMCSIQFIVPLFSTSVVVDIFHFIFPA